jgi:hypothetical protein
MKPTQIFYTGVVIIVLGIAGAFGGLCTGSKGLSLFSLFGLAFGGGVMTAGVLASAKPDNDLY